MVLPNKKEIFIGINIRPHWKESLDKIKDVYNIRKKLYNELKNYENMIIIKKNRIE